jgi:DnaK suppressor protein
MSLTGTVVTHLFIEDIDKLKQRLTHQRLDFLGSIQKHLHGGSEAGERGLPNHFAEVREQAEADLMAAADIGQLQTEMAELARIDAALARIATGVYGLCTRCEVPIALRRLRAIPAAELCLDCQMIFEQQRSHYPGTR